MLDYSDGHLSAVPGAELAAHATGLAARYRPGGLLGDIEHLRWLVCPPGAARAGRPARSASGLG